MQMLLLRGNVDLVEELSPFPRPFQLYVQQILSLLRALSASFLHYLHQLCCTYKAQFPFLTSMVLYHIS